MGKPEGFMEYERCLNDYLDPKKRILNWDEFTVELDVEKRKIQGARCMECGIPFCHSGIMLNNAASGCPINNLIPEWNDLIYNGLFETAYQRLKMTNNFPEFTGRVCPAPCEGSCTLGLNDLPVTIKNNEKFIIDYAWEAGFVKPDIPKSRSEKKVAVIGSGPAGLACADTLNMLGHKVTVYERQDRFGGLLMYGIPNMKLEKSVINRRIDLMKKGGIDFINNAFIGKDISPNKLIKDYDAVVICTGAGNPRDLNIENRDSNGIHFAVDFLTENTRAILDSLEKQNIMDYKSTKLSASGKDVVVIGGGDTGTDCVGTALRQGCKSVTQIEIMPKPPTERATSNPWPCWPQVLKTDYGQQEAGTIYGEDPRIWLCTVDSINKDNDGNVKSLNIVDVVWEKDENNRMIPKKVMGSKREIPAQLVLIAMGFLGPEDLIASQLSLKTDSRSNYQTLNNSYFTGNENVFVAGDARRGQSLVVWAIDEGRKAAIECHDFLSQEK